MAFRSVCYSEVMDVQQWDCDQDGTLTEAGLRRKLEQLGYSVTRYTSPPGTVFSDHAHEVDKMDAVVSGRFRVTIGEDSVILGPGDAILIPKGLAHRAEVVGEAAVVSLDGVKQ
jgi:quercetin dioxygenase-like cupin family protein